MFKNKKIRPAQAITSIIIINRPIKNTIELKPNKFIKGIHLIKHFLTHNRPYIIHYHSLASLFHIQTYK
jgi:hypothetical protein